MKMTQKGFTLIELMIVVAIIAILAAIAIPAYQDYIIRSQVSEGSTLTDGAKTAVAEFYSNLGTFPTNNESAGLASPASISGSYVKTVTIDKGKITAVFSKGAPQKANAAIDTKTFVLSPVAAVAGAGSTVWTCKGGTVDPKYLPTSCRQ